MQGSSRKERTSVEGLLELEDKCSHRLTCTLSEALGYTLTWSRYSSNPIPLQVLVYRISQGVPINHGHWGALCPLTVP
ncbi:hypothetical protein AAFF_G00062130 [Aldrovandia affinis]|uniref:Uncharacterized protein n=1 Tax=Aldrovandia affinis TaxID=143900 RepID=A0AAD7WDS4_9TELE|nr:hypothetical protein AAFF_G00062130 [Aldrovandia affinis]